MKVNLGGLNVELPGPVDAAVAQRAADEVTRRLEEAEANSTRIDTLGFALQAAMTLAIDLEQARAERDEDAVQMAKALQRIADRLQELVEDVSTEE